MWLWGTLSKSNEAVSHLDFVSYFWNTFPGDVRQAGVEKLVLTFFQFLQVEFHDLCVFLDPWIVPPQFISNIDCVVKRIPIKFPFCLSKAQ